MIPMLQMKKRRHVEFKKLAQGNGEKQQLWDLILQGLEQL